MSALMTERVKREVHATLDVLRPIVLDLRQRGYDATPWVEQRGDHMTVEVRIRIPALGIPIESATAINKEV